MVIKVNFNVIIQLIFKFGFIEEIHAEHARQIQDTKIQDILLSQGFFISCISYLVSLYLTAKQQFSSFYNRPSGLSLLRSLGLAAALYTGLSFLAAAVDLLLFLTLFTPRAETVNSEALYGMPRVPLQQLAGAAGADDLVIGENELFPLRLAVDGEGIGDVGEAFASFRIANLQLADGVPRNVAAEEAKHVDDGDPLVGHDVQTGKDECERQEEEGHGDPYKPQQSDSRGGSQLGYGGND